ncbi:MAG: hypothetical protein FJ144_03085 [Deltaproteobacteria bacterium]|nr:hypothetical protein [Deltaproteobacteria bacterium]
MLHFVRQHARSKVIWVMVFVIIGVFVFWGVEAVVSGPGVNTVATVGDQNIEPLDVARAENQLVQLYKENYKDAFTPQLREQLNLRQMALNGLIERAVLKEEADRLGIEIGDSELRDVILGTPAFQADGRFNKEAYMRILRYSRVTPVEYEESRREELAIQRLRDVVLDGVGISDAEVRQAIENVDETVSLDFVRFPAKEYEAQVVVDEAALSEFYEKNKDKYREPERVRISLVEYAPDKFMSEVQVAEEDVASFYEDNKAGRFTQPHEVRARHILIKVPAGADDETKAKARTKIEELQKKVADGGDFAAIATESSEDVGSAQKGGDLGFFSKGRMVPQFEEAAFALTPGQTSEIVESPFGFHLIRVEEVREERVKGIEEVRAEILEELQKGRAGDKAKEAATTARTQMNGGQTLEQIAETAGLVVDKPEPLGQGDKIPGVGRSFPLGKALFSMKQGEVTEATQVEGSWVIARLEEKIESRIPPLADVRSRAETDYRAEKASELAEKAAAEFLETAKKDGSIEKAAEAAGKPVDTTKPFKRAEPYIAGLGVNPQLKDDAFALTTESPLGKKPYVVLGDVVVVALDERQLPTKEQLDEKVEAQKTQLLEARQRSVFQRYLDELKAQAQIQVNTPVLEQLPAV